MPFNTYHVCLWRIAGVQGEKLINQRSLPGNCSTWDSNSKLNPDQGLVVHNMSGNLNHLATIWPHLPIPNPNL